MRRGERSPIVTLTLNPAVDLCFAVDRIEPTRKLRCHDLRRDPGGGGINVARVIQRLGGSVTAVFPAGGAAGARLEAMLDAEGLSYRAVPIAGETREDFTAEDRATGAEYRFVLPGPRLGRAELTSLLACVENLHPGILVASGSLPVGAPVGVLRTVARNARRGDARMVVDAAGAALRHALSAGVWLAKPNLAELEELTGAPLTDLPSRIAACRSLIRSGGAEIVALSMGREGALLVEADEAWRAPAVAVTPVSAIGAGDSFLAGLVFSLAEERPAAEALAYAVAAGSAALLAPGTQLARVADVRRFLPRVSIERVEAASATRSRPAAA